MKNHIPVFYSLNNNYALTTFAAIVSMLKNAKKFTFYDICLLVSEDFTEDNIKKMEKLNSMFTNFNLKVVNMGKQFVNGYESGHLTVQAYYRLVIAEMFPELDRCIYLDGDILVKDDLWELYNDFDFECYFSAVKAAGFYLCSEEQRKHVCEIIGLEFADTYINSGVLVLNLKKMRDDNIGNLLVKEIEEKNLPCLDQDALNTICYGKIHLLPCKYNVHAYFINNERIKEVFPLEEVMEARNRPVIIHYARKETKPWKDKEIIYAEEWWEIVSKSGFDISIIEKAERKNCLRKYSYFKSISASYNSIIIYGQLEDALEVDRQLKEKGEERTCYLYDNMNAQDIQKNCHNAFYIVVFQENIRQFINQLKKNGIGEERILIYRRRNKDYIFCIEKKYQKDYMY